jgi:hypothetical protein
MNVGGEREIWNWLMSTSKHRYEFLWVCFQGKMVYVLIGKVLVRMMHMSDPIRCACCKVSLPYIPLLS